MSASKREFEKLFDQFSKETRLFDFGDPSVQMTFDFWQICRSNAYCDDSTDPVLLNFINHIFPSSNGRIWSMAIFDFDAAQSFFPQDFPHCFSSSYSAPFGEFKFNRYFTDPNHFACAMETLSELYPFANIYYSPAMYSGWRLNENAQTINTVFLDIDGIDGVDFMAMTTEDLKVWFCENYDFVGKPFPDFCVSSGHGLHLYYITDTFDLQNDFLTWCSYIDQLVYFFGADPACRNRSRILRFPGSYNAKHLDDVKKTKIFQLTDVSDINISRLDCFCAGSDLIEQYVVDCNIRRGKKSNETRKRNLELKKSICIQNDINDMQPDLTDDFLNIPLDFSPLPEKSRYFRILRDIHNFCARRGGCPAGLRNLFCHIVGSILRAAGCSQDKAYYRVCYYIPKSFHEECRSVLDSVYHGKLCRYKNLTVAYDLGFEEEDFENAFSCYTKSERKQVKSERNRSYYRNSENARRVASNRKEEYEIVSSYWDSPISETAELLGCSIRKVKYIRAKIREREQAA